MIKSCVPLLAGFECICERNRLFTKIITKTQKHEIRVIVSCFRDKLNSFRLAE